MTKQDKARWLNETERILTFLSVHSLITDSEKRKVRNRMDKFWEKDSE